MGNIFFLVKADLLLHEKTFEKLRDYAKSLNVSKLNAQYFYSLEYSVEQDKIVSYQTDTSLYSNTCNFLTAFCSSGYILMDFSTLKSLM